MAAIFPPHGANIPDVELRYMIAGSVSVLEPKIMLCKGCQGFTRFPKKALRLLGWRFYCQNVLPGLKGSDTGFNPTKRALERADKEFELLGPKTTLQGSALKLEDAPKLKLPEVMYFVTFSMTAIEDSLHSSHFLSVSMKGP